MAPKTRYKNLSEINVALGFVAESVDKIEKVILGNGMHEGLLTAMVVIQKSLKEHLDKHKENEEKEGKEKEKIVERRALRKDKLWIGIILLVLTNIAIVLKDIFWKGGL